MARTTDTGTESTLPKTGTSVGLTCHSGQQGDHRRERGTMTRRSTRLLDAALAAAESGLYVFPVTPRSKIPAVRDWEQVATRDPEQIRTWWAARPYNIGAAVGRSGLVVIDLDLDHGRGEPPPDEFAGAAGGREVLAMLAGRAGEPAPFNTQTTTTPTGGSHLYFRAPAGLTLRNTVGVLGWRIDTRAHGGSIIVAGSVREQSYYRQTNHLPIADLPHWLATALTPAPPPARTAAPLELSGRRASAYVRAIVESEAHDVAAARTGTRHHARLKAARTLGRLVGGQELDEHDAYAALWDAAHRHIGEDCTEAEVEADLRHGLAYGRQLPRRIGSGGDPR